MAKNVHENVRSPEIQISAVKFRNFSNRHGAQLLQRSLTRGRLGHAYLFTGERMDDLESLARILAKTLNCQAPEGQGREALDCCDHCASCLQIQSDSHPDIHWARPESRSRVIMVDQMRELMREIQLKPATAAFKVAIIVAADRLNVFAANAFLKILEEPPKRTIMVLLSTEPARVIETILSRCLRLDFHGDGAHDLTAAQAAWIEKFSALASEQRTLLSRYRLAGVVLQELGQIRAEVEKNLAARSPLQKYADVGKELREKWEDELTAAVEAEYRRRRADVLLLVQRWLRDIWLLTLAAGQDLLDFPKLSAARTVAQKLSPRQALQNLQALENTQRLLHTNIQEALAFEVGFLKLHFG